MPSQELPVLETERLLLRRHHLDDFPHSAAMWADPNVTRFIREKPFTREESWARFLRYIGHWKILGFGYWVVLDKATNQFSGEVGFANFRRNIEPSLEDTPEIGWALTPPVQGKGYATEAVRAVVAWGENHFGSARTACIIAPENLASIRVAQKCGYRELQHTTYMSHPTIMFVRDPQPSK
jgi:RimJ/RimL family protein N-acetyltransferase